MANEQTLSLLRTLKLKGMAEAYEHQLANTTLQDLGFDERLAMLVDTERLTRENRKLNRLVKNAKFKVSASPENIDYKAARGLDKRKVQGLLSCDWIVRGQHVIITGPTGVGKTFLAHALGNQAVRHGLPVLYIRFARLLEQIELSRDDGSLPKFRAQLGKQKLVVVDDWGMTQLTAQHQEDLFDFFDDRTDGASVLITSQLPVTKWHAYLNQSTLADAILDRIIHSAHKLELKGESLRKTQAKRIED